MLSDVEIEDSVILGDSVWDFGGMREKVVDLWGDLGVYIGGVGE